jgi:hypothetical protein
MRKFEDWITHYFLQTTRITDTISNVSLSLPATNYNYGFVRCQSNPHHGYVHVGLD